MIKLKQINKGTYAAVRFTPETLDRIEELQKKLKLPDPVSRDKLHSTILYSRVWVPFVPEKGELLLGSVCRLESWKSQSNKNVLLLTYDSEYMRFRHDVGTALGATFDFPDYTPHVTLSYDIGSLKFNLGEIFNLELVRSKEYVEDLDLNWT